MIRDVNSGLMRSYVGNFAYYELGISHPNTLVTTIYISIVNQS